MNELMKGPNKRGREDFENAISDDIYIYINQFKNQRLYATSTINLLKKLKHTKIKA
jgi:hypothetical protein